MSLRGQIGDVVLVSGAREPGRGLSFGIQRRAVIALMFGLIACGDNFVQLPDVVGVQAWLLQRSNEPVRLFDADEAVETRLDARTQLVALPLSLEELGLPEEQAVIGAGRVVEVLERFSYGEGKWSADGPGELRLGFDPARCAGGCVVLHQERTLGCGSCSLVEPEPPEEPTRLCPPDWVASDEADGHHVCSMVVPEAIFARCADSERWSVSNDACVPFTACSPPVIGPQDDAIYYDPAAPAGGDGTQGNPLQRVINPPADATLVLSPGTHAAFDIDGVDVRVVGHGLCTVIDGGAANAVRLLNTSSSIEQVRLLSEESAVYLSETSTVSVSDVQIFARRAIYSFGSVALRRVSAVQNVSCDPHCAPLIDLKAASSLDDVDVVADAAIVAADAVSVRRSRLLSPERHIAAGVDAAGEQAVQISHSAILGFRTGAAIRTRGAGTASVSDTFISAEPITAWESAGEGLFFEIEGRPPVLRRVDIRSAGSGLFIRGAGLVANQLRIKSAGQAIGTSAEPTDVLDLTEVWFDFSRVGVNVPKMQANIVDGWLRRTPGTAIIQVDLNYASIRGLDGELRGERIHIVDHGSGLSALRRVEVDDFRIRDYQFAGIIFRASPGLPRTTLIGDRWSFQGVGLGFWLDSSIWSVSELAVAASDKMNVHTPICLRSSVSGQIDSFLLEAVDAPAIRLWNRDDTDTHEALTFRNGSYAASQLVSAGESCEGANESLDTWPQFHNVMAR